LKRPFEANYSVTVAVIAPCGVVVAVTVTALRVVVVAATYGVMVTVIAPCDVAVVVAIVAPHGAVAAVIVIMSSWPHYHCAIGAQ